MTCTLVTSTDLHSRKLKTLTFKYRVILFTGMTENKK